MVPGAFDNYPVSFDAVPGASGSYLVSYGAVPAGSSDSYSYRLPGRVSDNYSSADAPPSAERLTKFRKNSAYLKCFFKLKSMMKRLHRYISHSYGQSIQALIY